MIFHRNASFGILQLINQRLNFTYVLTLAATEVRIQILVFTIIELTTSAPLVGVRGYLLDHSGDECNGVLLCGECD